MGTKLAIGFLVIALFFVANSVVDGRPAKRNAIDWKLKLLNKPAVKTVHSEDGDIIDCVDIYKQPAFDHHALKNHKIQMKPSFDLPSDKKPLSSTNRTKNESEIFQTWQKSGITCPKGTIPIRRIRREDLERASSVEQFGRKPYSKLISPNETEIVPLVDDVTVTLGPVVNRSTALLVTAGYNYIGAAGDINVWNPNVESPDDFSAAKIYLKNGPMVAFESVEAGWAVNPKLYGDKRTRLTVAWTKDSYKTTGCFDLTCSGFIQTNPQVALGGALEPVTTSDSPKYIISVAISQDTHTGNWWLKVRNDIPIGYWPAMLLNYLRHSAILVEWGGEVYSANVKKTPHTATAMGSGSPADYLTEACYITNVRIIDYSLQLKYPEKVGTWADEPYCYNTKLYRESYRSEPIFNFGGRGRGYYCP